MVLTAIYIFLLMESGLFVILFRPCKFSKSACAEANVCVKRFKLKFGVSNTMTQDVNIFCKNR